MDEVSLRRTHSVAEIQHGAAIANPSQALRASSFRGLPARPHMKTVHRTVFRAFGPSGRAKLVVLRNRQHHSVLYSIKHRIQPTLLPRPWGEVPPAGGGEGFAALGCHMAMSAALIMS